MRRLQIILSSMLETGVKAVVEGRPNLAEEVLHMEEEADRIYWMVIRQLLLAGIYRGAATEGGRERPVRGGGDKGIAKKLAHMGDPSSHLLLATPQIHKHPKHPETPTT